MALTTIDTYGIKDGAVQIDDIGTLAGNLTINDSGKLRLGTGLDLQLYHDGSHSYIRDTGTGNLQIASGQTNIQDADLSHYQGKFIDGGAVELYHAGTKKFETTADGIEVTGKIFSSSHIDLADDVKLLLGTSDDLQIYHSSSSGKNIYQGASHEFWNAAGNEPLAKITENGGVELYYDDNKAFETHALGIKVIGVEGGVAQIDIQPDQADDNADKWKVGATDNGHFFISNKDSGAWDTNIECNRSGNVELYYDANKKFETVSNGAAITGNLGIGTTSPSRVLQIKSAGANATQIALIDNDSTNEVFQVGQQSDGDCFVSIRDDSGNTKISFDASGNSFLNGGNVGIGESASIDARLHVNSGTDNTTLFLESTDGDTNLGMADNAGSCRLLQAGGHLRFRTGGNANAFGTGDNERMVLDSNGRLIIGHTTSTGQDRIFQIIGTSADTSSAELRRHSADAAASILDFAKSRNATKGSNTIVQDDDTLGSIVFRGDDGTDLTSVGASIVSKIDGTPGANDMPGRLEFRTTPDGGNNSTERMRIASDGKVSIGTGTARQLLHLNASDSGAANIVFTNTTTGTSSSDGFIIGITGSEDGQFWHQENKAIRFATNNAERLRIAAGGEVNIGAASPTASENGQFNCYTTTSSGKAQFVHDAGTGGLRLAGTGSGSGANLVFSNNYSSGTFSDHWTLTHNGADDSFRFLSGGTGGTERLRIDSGGRLGVGLTPNTSDVATNVTEGLIQTDGNIDIRYAGVNTDPAGARYLNFINTDTTLVAGQPMGGLHWIGNDSSNTDTITASITALNSGSGGASAHILFKTGGTERFRIEDDGPVLIGTTSSTTLSSAALLQIEGSTSATGLSILRTASAGGQIQFGAGSSGDNVTNNDGLGHLKFFGFHTNGYDEYARISAAVQGTPGDGDAPGALIFYTTADGASSVTEQMRIDPSGRLGINQTSPTKMLHVVESSSASGNIVAKFKGGTGADSETFIAIVDGYDETSGDVEGHVKIGAKRNGATNKAHIVFHTYNNSASMGERLRIQNNGGISFNGDTAAANALDDYEEGTWTVQLTGGSSGTSNDGNSGTGFDTASGVYTKVGNTVHYTMHLANVHDGDCSGDLRFSLPFTAGNGQSSTQNLRCVGACAMHGVDYTQVGQVNGYIEEGDSYARIAETLDNGSLDYLNVNNVDHDGNDLYMSGLYFV